MPVGPYSAAPRPVPEIVMADERAAEIERREDAVADPDEMRDEPSALDNGGWIVVLLGILGIAGLFLLMYWLAGVL